MHPLPRERSRGDLVILSSFSHETVGGIHTHPLNPFSHTSSPRCASPVSLYLHTASDRPRPVPPRWFWPVYGAYMAAACGLGRMSYKRPACDIFIAGITQFPTTAYCVVALASGSSRRWPTRHSTASSSSSSCDNPTAASSSSSSSSSPIDLVRLPYRIMYYAGFVGNSPLLPMYPLLVQYSGMSLGAINTLLHACESHACLLFNGIFSFCLSGEKKFSLLRLLHLVGAVHLTLTPPPPFFQTFGKISRVDDHVGYAGNQSLTSNQSDRFRVESLEKVLILDDVED